MFCAYGNINIIIKGIVLILRSTANCGRKTVDFSIDLSPIKRIKTSLSDVNCFCPMNGLVAIFFIDFIEGFIQTEIFGSIIKQINLLIAMSKVAQANTN